MSRKGDALPIFWIVAGPNGCGKSTAYGRNDVAGFDGSVWIINPDLLTARLQVAERLCLVDANLVAVQRIEIWLDASIEVHQTIGVETVLSSSKYRRLVLKAKEHGFEVRLIYVFVDSVERQLERIAVRVAKGGYDVPEAKVRERHERSIEQLLWFFAQADHAWVIDNSSSEPRPVAEKQKRRIDMASDLPDDIRKSLLGAA